MFWSKKKDKKLIYFNHKVCTWSYEKDGKEITSNYTYYSFYYDTESHKIGVECKGHNPYKHGYYFKAVLPYVDYYNSWIVGNKVTKDEAFKHFIKETNKNTKKDKEEPLGTLSLEDQLNNAIEEERFEDASRIQKEIDKLNKK